MSDEGRRIFPLETALKVLANKSSSDVIEFFEFTLQRDLCEATRGFVAPVVKGWLVSQHPDFMKCACPSVKPYDMWVNDAKEMLGDHVSLLPMPKDETAGIWAALDALREAKQTASEKVAEIAEAVARADAAESFKAKAEKLQAQVAQLEEKNKSLSDDLSKAKAEAAAFAGKVAIDQNGIEQSIKDMVSKAVKDALAVLPAGGGATAEVNVAEAAPTPEESGNTVPDSFGFGTSGSDGDGFGF